MNCSNCGAQVHQGDRFCPSCGSELIWEPRQAFVVGDDDNLSDKNWVITFGLCLFLGYLGVHRYYVGKISTGVLWTCTAGCFVIGWLVNLVTIISGKFTDSFGLKIDLPN